MPQDPKHIIVQDLLGRPPGWLLRSGIGMVFVVVMLAFVLAAVIRYPDQLTGRAVLQYQNAPVQLTPRLSAPLDSLLAQTGEEVTTGQLIAVLQSAADWQQVQALQTDLANDQVGLSYSQLGTLAAPLAAYQAANQTLNYLTANNSLATQRANLNQRIQQTHNLIAANEAEQALLQKRIALTEQDLARQAALLSNGSISQAEYDQIAGQLLLIQQELQRLTARKIDHQLSITRNEAQLEVLDRAYSDNLQTLQQDATQQRQQLIGAIQTWEERYLLRAPVSGTLHFAQPIVEKQRLAEGELFGTIQPHTEGTNEQIALIQLPAQGIGKIAIGARVILRLDAYPEKEFGVINTKLTRIATLPQTSAQGEVFYQLTAELPSPMLTTYGQPISPQPLQTATATIITAERSLLGRLLASLRDARLNN